MTRKVLLNYADGAFLEAQKLNTRTGVEVAGFDAVASLGRGDVDRGFALRHKRILDAPRGAGYWLWKPFLIWRMLTQELKDGEVLFYCDSGAHFLRPVDQVVEICQSRRDFPLLLFTLQDELINRVWTKRDCFVILGQDEPRYADAPQILASFLIMEKSKPVVDFVTEWLRRATDPRVITDEPNTCGLPNYDDFKDHRHDQSILSLLGRKHGVSTIPDISQWGDDRRPSDIPRVIAATRWRA